MKQKYTFRGFKTKMWDNRQAASDSQWDTPRGPEQSHEAQGQNIWAVGRGQPVPQSVWLSASRILKVGWMISDG